IVLLVLAAGFAVGAIARRDRSVEAGVIGAAVVAYLIYALAGAVFHRTVYYGRLLHMYAPMLVLAAIPALKAIPSQIARRLAAGALVLASIGAFAPVAARSLTIEFPSDVERGVMTASPGEHVC